MKKKGKKKKMSKGIGEDIWNSFCSFVGVPSEKMIGALLCFTLGVGFTSFTLWGLWFFFFGIILIVSDKIDDFMTLGRIGDKLSRGSL